MTTQAEELLGVQVIGADGKVIGTIEQVFGDEVDGPPTWARIRAGKASRFVPVGNSHVTRDGLNVPFDAQTIMGGPKIEAGKEISAKQAEELSGYYGLAVPAQAGARGEAAEADQRAEAEEASQRAEAELAAAEEAEQRAEAEKASERAEAEEADRRAEAEEADRRREAEEAGRRAEAELAEAEEAEQRAEAERKEEWLLRREERLNVGTEVQESGHVKLHRYVDVEPSEQTLRLFHEEYDVERIPLAEDEPTEGDLEEGEQEVTLHEERGIMSKQAVPVERMRLVTRRVEEDETFRDDVRRERIEIEPEEATAGGRGRNKSRS